MEVEQSVDDPEGEEFMPQEPIITIEEEEEVVLFWEKGAKSKGQCGIQTCLGLPPFWSVRVIKNKRWSPKNVFLLYAKFVLGKVWWSGTSGGCYNMVISYACLGVV